MTKKAVSSVSDIESFFSAYNEHDWDAMFNYMSDDCLWDASERRLEGRNNIIDYWMNFHSSFKETLGRPENVVFGDNVVYLQVPVRLDFIDDGSFYGKQYKKGDVLNFKCTDFYRLNEEGKIAEGRVYVKFKAN